MSRFFGITQWLSIRRSRINRSDLLNCRFIIFGEKIRNGIANAPRIFYRSFLGASIRVQPIRMIDSRCLYIQSQRSIVCACVANHIACCAIVSYRYAFYMYILPVDQGISMILAVQSAIQDPSISNWASSCCQFYHKYIIFKSL